jgi:hypothetical protein
MQVLSGFCFASTPNLPIHLPIARLAPRLLAAFQKKLLTEYVKLAM